MFVLQVLKGYRDGQNGTLPNAHLVGVFHRVCKLLTYRIKPVFVFDGGVPSLKQQTLVRRNMVYVVSDDICGVIVMCHKAVSVNEIRYDAVVL